MRQEGRWESGLTRETAFDVIGAIVEAQERANGGPLPKPKPTPAQINYLDLRGRLREGMTRQEAWQLINQIKSEEASQRQN